MMMTSETPGGYGMLRGLVQFVGFILVIAGLMPTWQFMGGTIRTEAERDFVVKDPENSPSRSEFTLGIPLSPMLHWYREKLLTTVNGQVAVTLTSSVSMHLLSYSTVCLLVGVGLLYFARQRGRPVLPLDVANPTSPSTSSC